MTVDTSHHENRDNSPAARTDHRIRWLIGGLIALGAALMVCLAVASVGLFAWRRVATVASRPAAVVQPSTPAPAERLPAEAPSAVPLPKPAGAASGGRIAFIDPDGRLGTVAPDGTDQRLLSDVGWRFQFPAWSPDGRQIAAVGSDGEQGAVRVFSDEPAPAQVDLYNSRTQSPFYLYWAPDGRQVSFLANARRGIGLWLAPADGREEARLLATGQPFYWDWTGDSTQLLVHTGTIGDDARLGFIDTQGESSGAAIATPGLFQAPGISFDGRYLGYADAEDRDLQVVVEDQSTGGRATAAHAGLVALGWSPTDPFLAFTSPTAPRASFVGPLRLLDATSGYVRTLVDEPVAGFFWSPTGRSIAYLTLEAGSMSPGATRPSGLAAPASLPDHQDQHPDIRLSLWVVDVADGRQTALFSFQPTHLFVTQFLPFFDQYALSHRLWSPAGDAIVLPVVESGGREAIVVVPIDGRRAERLIDGSMAFWSP
jgi:TolB protein